MFVGLLIAILLCGLAGAALIWLGLRGQATDAHPICRRCGFDLHGRFPWSQPTLPTCPDCGTALIAHRSVRPGARAFRTRLLACGCMLCFPGLMLLLAGAADTLAGGSTAALKPTSLIASQVSGGTKGSATLGALITRVAVGSAQQADIQPAIERALALQADRRTTLDPQWLDLLETARRHGQLSATQTDRYFASAFEWQLHARSAAEREPMTFALQGFADRLAKPPSPLFVTVSYLDGSLDGRPLSFPTTTVAFSTPPLAAPLAPNTLLEVIDWAGHSAPAARSLTLTTSWQVEVHTGSATGPLISLWTINADEGVDVTAPPQRGRYAIADAQTRDRLISGIALRTITLERDTAGACWAAFSIAPGSLDVDVVAALHLTTADGNSYDSNDTVTITPSDPRWPLITTADPTRSPWNVRVKLTGTPPAGRCKVELVPLASVARNSTLATRVWEGEPLRFDGVELKWPSPPTVPTP